MVPKLWQAGMQQEARCHQLAESLMAVQYNVGEAVRLWVNKVGPYNNPQETYNYYYLPFCKPKGRDKPGHKWGGLGEVLQGNELIDSQLDIKYRSECRPFALMYSATALLAVGPEGMPRLALACCLGWHCAVRWMCGICDVV